MRRAGGLPFSNAPRPNVRLPLPIRQTRLNPKSTLSLSKGARSPHITQITIELLQIRRGLGCGMRERQPAISQARHAAQRRIGMSPKPERDRALDGERIDPRIRDGVPATGKVDERLRPQLAQDGDLLLDPAAPVVEILIQPEVFDFV